MCREGDVRLPIAHIDKENESPKKGIHLYFLLRVDEPVKSCPEAMFENDHEFFFSFVFFVPFAVKIRRFTMSSSVEHQNMIMAICMSRSRGAAAESRIPNKEPQNFDGSSHCAPLGLQTFGSNEIGY